jgi:hypothetical protein
MLFRAQVPLTATFLAGADDDRLVLVFECHTSESCREGQATVVRGPALATRPPPEGSGPVVHGPPRGGELAPLAAIAPAIPFDPRAPADDVAAELADSGGELRAVLGPSPRSPCGACGRNAHAAVRFVSREAYACDVEPAPLLGPTTVHICPRCDMAWVERSTGTSARGASPDRGVA